MLKGCPHFHVTFPGWLGTPEHPEMPHILSTPSYSDLQPGATRPRETAWLPEGPAWLRDYQKWILENHNLQKLKSSKRLTF